MVFNDEFIAIKAHCRQMKLFTHVGKKVKKTRTKLTNIYDEKFA
jgi:hypothetical protein